MNVFMIIGGFVAGSLCGLVPFFMGRRKGQQDLATIALLVCAFCGMILGILLALPAAIVFTIVIVNKGSSARASNADLATGTQLPPPASSKVCSQCGVQLAPDAKFCGVCSHPLS
jgi:hypothetical protein